MTGGWSRAVLLAVVMLVGISGPAAAHRLKVFATVVGGEVSGYGFFVGGGRARNASVTATDEAGGVLYQGATDEQGQFAFVPSGPVPEGLTVTVNGGDGHVASMALGPERFGAPAGSGLESGTGLGIDPGPSPVAVVSPSVAPMVLPQAPGDALAAEISRQVEAAVARQLRPFLEARAEAESEVRVRDVAGGLGMILGLTGIGLWAYGRRRS